MLSPPQRRAPIGWTDFPEQQQPQGGFVWGQGGAQLTQDQLAERMEMARALSAPDFSPVQHWSQGVGRVAQNVLGALDERSLGKQQGQVNADAQARIIAALGKDADLAPLFTGGDKVAAALAGDVFNLRNPKPSTAQPYRFEDNAGNVWQVGPTGQPERIFTDSVPKYYIQGDQAIQIANPFLQGGGDQSVSGMGAPDTLPPDFDFGEGGSASAPNSFPSGNPLEPPRW